MKTLLLIITSWILSVQGYTQHIQNVRLDIDSIASSGDVKTIVVSFDIESIKDIGAFYIGYGYATPDTCLVEGKQYFVYVRNIDLHPKASSYKEYLLLENKGQIIYTDNEEYRINIRANIDKIHVPQINYLYIWGKYTSLRDMPVVYCGNCLELKLLEKYCPIE